MHCHLCASSGSAHTSTLSFRLTTPNKIKRPHVTVLCYCCKTYSRKYEGCLDSGGGQHGCGHQVTLKLNIYIYIFFFLLSLYFWISFFCWAQKRICWRMLVTKQLLVATYFQSLEKIHIIEDNEDQQLLGYWYILQNIFRAQQKNESLVGELKNLFNRIVLWPCIDSNTTEMFYGPER